MKFRRNDQPFTFRAKVKDAARLRQELADGTATGEVELVVAAFGIPDTGVAVGNTRKQIIDKGAFREWLQELDFDNDPPLGFVDHGGAVETGSHSARLLIGYAYEGEELAPGDERLPEAVREFGGLLLRTRYNLNKQVGREAFSDLIHNPAGVQFSFGWDPSREKTELRDGQEHVTQLYLTEWSQVAFGAQRAAGLVAARAKASNLGGESLETLPREVRAAWWEQIETMVRAFEKSWAWIEEVFSTDGAREGFVVVGFEDAGFAQVPWMRMDDGTIAFDTSQAVELEQEWVTTGKSVTGDEAQRSAALSGFSPAMLESAVVDTNKMRAEVKHNPLADFYDTMLDDATGGERQGSLTTTP